MLKELLLAQNSKANYLYFMPTARCNAFCDFCWNWENVADAGKLYKSGQDIKRKELSLAEIEKFTEKLPKMLTVVLYGGEPFIREEFKQILGLFAKKSLHISIPTNGFYTDKIVDDLNKNLRDNPKTSFRIHISLDGPERVHNRVRKLKDGYQNALSTANALHELKKSHQNLSLICNSNYNADTAETMPDHIENIFNLDIFDFFDLNVIRGRPYDPELEKIDFKEFFKLKKMVTEKNSTKNQPYPLIYNAIEEKTAKIVEDAIENPGERKFKCFALKKFCVVSDIGEVVPCEELLDHKMGNIRDYDYDLELLLKNQISRQEREDIENKKCNCRWECAISTTSVFDSYQYPSLSWEIIKSLVK